MREITAPLLCVSAWGDGIVPRATARYSYEMVRSPLKKLLEVGTANGTADHAANPAVAHDNRMIARTFIACFGKSREGLSASPLQD